MRIDRHTFSITAFVCCLISSSLAGQETQPPQNGRRFSISGSVVNSVTGEPLRKALVQIFGPEQRSVFTGLDGRFEMEKVLEGDYSASAQKPGYGSQQPSWTLFSGQNRSAFGGVRFSVTNSSSQIVIKLIPNGSLQGRVSDSNGEPVEGIPIRCQRAIFLNGDKSWQDAGFAVTDDQGGFNVADLEPGAYLIKTGLKAEFPGLSEASGASTVQRVYAEQYYPGASNKASAQAIVIELGEAAQLNLSVSLVKAFSISGVLPPEGSISRVAVEDEEGGIVRQSLVNRKTGVWVARALPAGLWKVRSQTRDNQYVEETVQIASSDVNNVQLVSQPSYSIPLLVSGLTTEAAKAVMIYLRSQNSRYRKLFPARQDEGLAVQDARPGSYRVIAQNIPSGCVESISAGGVDLTRNMLTIAGGSQPPPIQLSVTQNCAEVAGRVQGDGLAAGSSVVLLPESLTQEPLTIQISSADVSFSLSGLSPGSYQVYAFSSIKDLEYANPEALREFSGEKLSLAGGEKKSVTLKLNVRN